MTKIFGVQRNKDSKQISLKNKMASRVFFMRYPTIFTYLQEKLTETASIKSDNLSIQPVLLILARLYPINEEDEKQVIERNCNIIYGNNNFHISANSIFTIG